MRIRILRAIVGPGTRFYPGQVIDVSEPTPEMLAWLSVPVSDGSFRAEVVRDEPELATVGVPERAVERRGRRR